MSDSRWLKSWLEANNSYYVGIGKDMLADIYIDNENADEEDD